MKHWQQPRFKKRVPRKFLRSGRGDGSDRSSNQGSRGSGSDGKPRKCYNCDQQGHFAKNSPHRQANKGMKCKHEKSPSGPAPEKEKVAVSTEKTDFAFLAHGREESQSGKSEIRKSQLQRQGHVRVQSLRKARKSKK